LLAAEFRGHRYMRLISSLRKNSVYTYNSAELSLYVSVAAIAQDAQTGLFCSSGLSGLSDLTKQTRQTK
jgi:hypothetical protein